MEYCPSACIVNILSKFFGYSAELEKNYLWVLRNPNERNDVIKFWAEAKNPLNPILDNYGINIEKFMYKYRIWKKDPSCFN